MNKKIKGSNWPQLPEELSNISITPTDARFDAVRSNYFRVGNPKLVIMAATNLQVSETIKYITAVRKKTGSKVPFSVRSGGHGMTMSSVNDGGIILDISQMNEVTIVDEKSGLVRIQAGALWGDVAKSLNPYQLVISSGDFGDTGVGGLATSGGIGLLVRNSGLTIDHIIGASLVTSDGECHWIDEKHEPDLFWAIRGGSSQVGIVTEFLFKADRLVTQDKNFVSPVVVQKVKYLSKKLETFILKWQEWANSSSRRLSSILMVTLNENGDYIVEATNIWAGSPNEQSKDIFEKSLNLERTQNQEQQTMEYADLVKAPHEPHRGQQPVYVKNTLVENFNAAVIDQIEAILKNSFVMGIELRAIGGKLNEIKSEATPWDFREATGFVAMWADKNYAQQAQKIFTLADQDGLGVYGAYSSDLSEKENSKVWPRPETRERLKNIMNASDSEQIFDQGRNLNVKK
ncbi:FAD-binding oxidoreductase [Liquorilactobacillus uvarum]|uniref:FAD-binding oxidoreductase n=2 Tax=Bacillati TaxID=1783272 RepID=UPI0028895B4C|nr:FAD-dependent oxidoreductase [Liquorilactobacillus uvarum]